MTYDVAIVGAGPAGSVTALMLGRAGFRIALMGDLTEQPNTQRGETLAPGSAPVLTRLQLAHEIDQLRMPRVTGFSSSWGSSRVDCRPSLLVPDATTFVVDRGLFDRTLRNAATAAGAAMLPGLVDEVHREGIRWRVVRRCGNDISAHVVVDATGRGSRFARRAGARLLPVDKLVAVTTVLDSPSEDIDRTVEIESLPHGWLFTTLNAAGDRVVNFFTDGDLWSSGVLKDTGQSLIRKLANSRIMARYSRYKQRYPTHVWSAATLILDRAIQPGLLAVGDAAQTRDPLSSQGITAAMEDAESATTALIAALEGHALAVMEGHERRRRQGIKCYLRDRYRYYAAEARWSESQFWSRRHDVSFLTPLVAKFSSVVKTPPVNPVTK